MTGALTTQGAADYLQVSIRTLEDWRRKGGGPVYCKIGKCVRYLPTDLDKFLEAGRHTSTGSK